MNKEFGFCKQWCYKHAKETLQAGAEMKTIVLTEAEQAREEQCQWEELLDLQTNTGTEFSFSVNEKLETKIITTLLQ